MVGRPSSTFVISRYLLPVHGVDGIDKETPSMMFERVAKNIASAETKYGGDPDAYAKEFFEMMMRLDFLCNSPTLMNAGTPVQQLAACFVLPIADSVDSIFDTLKNAVLIQKSGGGTGFNFSYIRESGAKLKTGGTAAGPVKFMKVRTGGMLMVDVIIRCMMQQ